MSKYLVTGANGFVGSTLIKELLDNNEEVFAVIRSRSSKLSLIENLPGVKIIVCSLEEIHKLPYLIDCRDIDTCIHLAWDGSTGDARADFNMQIKNVQYSTKLIQVLKKMNIKRFVGAGTLAEFDIQLYIGLDSAMPKTVSHYGTAKIAAHYMTKTECASQGIEHIWCYLSNTYGEGNYTNNFINFASKLMLQKKRASFTSGEQMYDFVYIKDTVRAIYATAKYGKTFSSYYLGSTKQRKLKEYINIIRDYIDPSIELFLGEIPFQGKNLPDELFDSTKLISDTGYIPNYIFEDTIAGTIEWIKKELL